MVSENISLVLEALQEYSYLISCPGREMYQYQAAAQLIRLGWAPTIVEGRLGLLTRMLCPNISDKVLHIGDTHKQAIHTAILNRARSVALFEDDVILRRDSQDILIDALRYLPAAWDVLYLGGNVRAVKQVWSSRLDDVPGASVQRLLWVGEVFGAHAYILSSTGIDKFLNHMVTWRPLMEQGNAKPFDLFPADWVKYHVAPICAIQASGMSSTDGVYRNRLDEYWDVFNKAEFFKNCF